MRILITYENLVPTPQADAEQFVNNAAALARRGHHVDLLLPRNPERTRPPRDEVLGYYQVEAPLHVDELPSWSFSLYAQHVRHAMVVPRDRRFALADLVYTRNLGMATACLLAGQRVLYEHFRPWPDQFPPMQPSLRFVMTHPRFLGMITHSAFARASYVRLGVPEARLRVCHNGFEPSRMGAALTPSAARAQLGLPDDARIVAYVGRMNHRKGLDTALAIARRLPSHRFLLVGSTGHGEIEREAATIPNVIVAPWQRFADTAPYLYAADVLLVPPSTSPLVEHGNTVLPLKLFMYLAAGRPIFGPDAADVRELLVPGENAVLASPGDVEGAARALDELLRDEAARERLGAGALARSRTLTWDARAERVEAFIEERLRVREPERPAPWSAARCARESLEWLAGFPRGRFVRPTLPSRAEGTWTTPSAT